MTGVHKHTLNILVLDVWVDLGGQNGQDGQMVWMDEMVKSILSGEEKNFFSHPMTMPLRRSTPLRSIHLSGA